MPTLLPLWVDTPQGNISSSDVVKELIAIRSSYDGVVEPTTDSNTAKVLATQDRDKAVAGAKGGLIVVYFPHKDSNEPNLEVDYSMTGLVVVGQKAIDGLSRRSLAVLVDGAFSQLLAVQRFSTDIDGIRAALEQTKTTSLRSLKRTLGIYQPKTMLDTSEHVFVQTQGLLFGSAAASFPSNVSKAKVTLIELREGDSNPADTIKKNLRFSAILLATPIHTNNKKLLEQTRTYRINFPWVRVAVVFFSKERPVTQNLLLAMLADGLDEINHRGHLSAIGDATRTMDINSFNTIADQMEAMPPPVSVGSLFQKLTLRP